MYGIIVPHRALLVFEFGIQTLKLLARQSGQARLCSKSLVSPIRSICLANVCQPLESIGTVARKVLLFLFFYF
jgi:hypothetical protein